MKLVEDDGVEMPARSALVRGDLARDRVPGDVRVRLRGLLDVLEEDDRARMAFFQDFDFVLAKVADWPAVSIGDLNIEAHQLDARPERCWGFRGGAWGLRSDRRLGACVQGQRCRGGKRKETAICH